jgi:acyl-CoA thioester hydrolase
MFKKFITKIQIRFRDLDAMNHVNNAVYLSYFEYGRLAFFNEVLHAEDVSDFPFILASAQVNFFKPILLKTREVILKMWAGDFGNKSYKFFYDIYSVDEKIKFADGFTVQVFFDYKTGKTIKIPEEFIDKIKDYITS